MANRPNAVADTLLREDLRLMRDTVRQFAEQDVRPTVMQYDEAQEFQLPLVRKMGDLGLLGAVVPAALGGAGLGPREFIVIMEEIARVDPSLGLTFAAHSGLCLQHLLLFANPPQAQRYIPDRKSVV